MSLTLGIIGGGQLGMMLTEAARDMKEITGTMVLDPTRDCPASQAGARQILADFKDRDAIKQLAETSDIITYEIESGDSSMLQSLEDVVEINPSPRSLAIIQDKLAQKTFLHKHDIPVPEFSGIDSAQQIIEGVGRFGYPAVLKARTGGYDGRGNYIIHEESDVSRALEYFGDASLMLERFVPYVKEVSVVVARNTLGQTTCYPPVENLHHDSILRQTISPARIDPKTAWDAERVALRTVQILQGAGVFGIEMFVMKDGSVLINEIAPRVHNSGHHTLQSCPTTQFQQHLRAILGMELGSTTPYGPAIMYNILGPDDYTGPYDAPRISHSQAYLKMYGKHVSKPRRKLGHLNIVSRPGQQIDDVLKILEHVKGDARVLPKA